MTWGALTVGATLLLGGLWTDDRRASAGRCLLVASLWWWGWVWPFRQVMVDFGLPQGRWALLGIAQSAWWAVGLMATLMLGRRWPLAAGLLWASLHGAASLLTLLPVTLQLPLSLAPGAGVVLPWLGSATVMGALVHLSLVSWQRRGALALLVWLGALAGGPWGGRDPDPMSVRLLASDVGPFDGRRGSLYEERMRALAPLLRRGGVDLVVTGESAWPIDEPPPAPAATDVLLGASAPGVHAGSTWWLSPGASPARLAKPRPVPGVELPPMHRPDGRRTLRIGGHDLGVLQCYSGWSAFGPRPLPSHQDAWVWQANDAWLTPTLARWHWLAARLLALDTHLPVVRAGQSGWSGVWRPDGVVSGTLPFASDQGDLKRPRHLQARFTTGRPRSLPRRWLGLALATGLLLLGRRCRSR